MLNIKWRSVVKLHQEFPYELRYCRSRGTATRSTDPDQINRCLLCFFCSLSDIWLFICLWGSFPYNVCIVLFFGICKLENILSSSTVCQFKQRKKRITTADLHHSYLRWNILWENASFNSTLVTMRFKRPLTLVIWATDQRRQWKNH